MKDNSIAVCTPHANDMVPGLYAEAMATLGVVFGIRVMFKHAYYQPIAKARNELVHKALSYKSISHVLFVDDDILIRPHTLELLYKADKDMVSAWCPIRAPFVKSNVFPDMKPKQGLVEIDECGTGCVLIKREVFDRVANGQPISKTEFFRWVGSTLNPVSEDIYFCRIAKRYGAKIWCQSDAEVQHLGSGVYSSEGFKTIKGAKNVI